MSGVGDTNLQRSSSNASGSSSEGTFSRTKRAKTHFQKFKSLIKGKASNEEAKKLTGDSPVSSPRHSDASSTSSGNNSPRSPIASHAESPVSPSDLNEIDRQFQEIVKEMGIKDEKKVEQLKQNFKTPEQKWNMILMMKKAEKKQDPVEYYIEKLKKKEQVTEEFLQTLCVQLRTQRITWIETFLRLSGIDFLLLVLNDCIHQQDNREDRIDITHQCILCLNAILNSEVGVKGVLKCPEILRVMVLLLKDCKPKTKSLIFVLLAVLCHHSDYAFILILDAWSYFRVITNEHKRFHHLTKFVLSSEYETDLKVNCMILINAMLTSSKSRIIRTGIQQEFHQLNLLEKLKNMEILNKDFQTQVNIYEEEMSLRMVNFRDFTNVAEISQVINGQLTLESQMDFKQMLNDLLLIVNLSADDDIRTRNFVIVKKSISYIAKTIGHDGKARDISKENEFKGNIYEEINLLVSYAKDEIDVPQEKVLLLREIHEAISDLKKRVADSCNFMGDVTVTPEDSNSQKSEKKSPEKSEENVIPRKSEQSINVESTSQKSQDPKVSVSTNNTTIPSTKETTGFNAPPPPITTTAQAPPPPGAPPAMGIAPPPPMTTQILNLPSLPNVTPMVAVRNFHCDVIHKAAVGKTLFMKKGIAEKTKNVQLETEILEEMFKSSSSGTTADKKTSMLPTQQIQSLLDPKRSNNVGIQLASLRISFSILKKAILQMDESIVTPQRLNILKNIAPNEDEIELLSSYTGDIKQLGETEKFFYEMKDIPMLKERLDSWVFKSKFKNDVANIIPELDVISQACDEVINSDRFLEFLSVVLAIANFLNAKGRLKNSYGFRLSSLNKLRDTKSADGKSNLLKYVADYLERNRSDIAHFYEDFHVISQAERVSLVQHKETYSNVKTQLHTLFKTLSVYQSTPNISTDDPFIKVMESFAQEAKNEIKELELKMNATSSKLNELAQAFAEDKNTLVLNPETFFAQLSGFINSYALLVKKPQKVPPSKKSPFSSQANDKIASDNNQNTTSSSLINQGSDGLLSSIEKSLRDGSAFRNKRAFA